MAVTTENPVASSVANGVTTSFPHSFTVLSAADLVVQGELGNVTTVYDFGADYTLTGVGSSSGSVEFLAPPAAGTVVTRYRSTQIKRETDYQTNGDLLAAAVNRDFDRIWHALRDMNAGTLSSLAALRAPEGESLSAFADATARAGKLPVFDGSGDTALSSFTSSQLAQAVAASITEWDAGGVPIFGVSGDGTTDVTASLQAALDSNRVYQLPPGRYRITSNLIVDPARNRNCGFIGQCPTSRYPETSQAGGPVGDGKEECGIWYDGPTGSTTAMIAASPAPVGVDPSVEGDYTAFDSSVQTFTLQDVVLDGGDKAHYGLYCARVQRLQIRRAVVINSVEAGVSINGSYSGSIESCLFTRNLNRGLELGDADARWGWSVNDKVNALYMRDIHCVANGRDKTFDESIPAQARRGCGIFYGPHRGVMLQGLVSELNWGPNIIFQPSGSGNFIDGFYTELGCKYAPDGPGSDAITLGKATQQWGLVFIGNPGATHCAASNGVLAADWAWLTGSSPTAAREEGAFELSRVSLAGGLKADWAAYRLVNCALELENITGSQPAGAFTILGGLQFGAGLDILNVYDEGTFTPTLAGGSTAGTGWAYSVQAGSYTRIGRAVFFTARITLSAIGSGAVGTLEMGGLPAPIRNGNNYYAACQISGFGALATSVVGLSARCEVNTSKLVFFKLTAAATAEAALTVADLSSTATFTISGHYTV